MLALPVTSRSFFAFLITASSQFGSYSKRPYSLMIVLLVSGRRKTMTIQKKAKTIKLTQESHLHPFVCEMKPPMAFPNGGPSVEDRA
jgi:hypothetical protein